MARELPNVTAEWLLERVIQKDGCLVWKHECCNGGRDPRGSINKQRFYVRRAVWKAFTGKAPRAGWDLGVSCGTPGCCEPAHLVHRPKSESRAKGPKPLLTKVRIAEAKRRNSDLEQSAVDEIRSSRLSAAKEAAARGLHKSTVILIRANKIRRDYRSPFHQLWAR
jgi:hypothetical protein